MNNKSSAPPTFYPDSPDTILMTGSDTDVIKYAACSYDSYISETFMKRNLDAGISILNQIDEPVWIRGDSYYEVIKELTSKYNLVATTGGNIILINDNLLVVFDAGSEEIDNVTIFCSTYELAKQVFDDVTSFNADARKLSFNWFYNIDGRSAFLTTEMTEVVDKTLYPFIDDFDTFADRFLASTSNILILQGDPGTGKTTFIKHLIERQAKRAYLTYDSQILSDDNIFAQYMQDASAGSFIIEDADLFLKSRADGNGMVARFLNIGDGLIKMKDKKLIFSTNLPNVNDIDPALLRPGRCFQVINFRNLTATEAKVIADTRGFELPVDKNTYTLAEVFNSPVKTEGAKSKFGFC